MKEMAACRLLDILAGRKTGSPPPAGSKPAYLRISHNTRYVGFCVGNVMQAFPVPSSSPPPDPIQPSPVCILPLESCISMRAVGTISGDVLFSAQKPSINFLRRFTGYVEQFDTLLDILTVRCALFVRAA